MFHTLSSTGTYQGLWRINPWSTGWGSKSCDLNMLKVQMLNGRIISHGSKWKIQLCHIWLQVVHGSFSLLGGFVLWLIFESVGDFGIMNPKWQQPASGRWIVCCATSTPSDPFSLLWILRNPNALLNVFTLRKTHMAVDGNSLKVVDFP